MLKQKRWRSEKYKKWVKSQPCVISGMPADDPHHAIGIGLSGMGLTAPDWSLIPVTRGNHGVFHSTPELWPEQWKYIAQTLGKAIEDGILVVAE